MLIANNDIRGVNTMASRPSITIVFICSTWLTIIPMSVRAKPTSIPSLKIIDGISYTVLHHTYISIEYNNLIDA